MWPRRARKTLTVIVLDRVLYVTRTQCTHHVGSPSVHLTLG